MQAGNVAGTALPERLNRFKRLIKNEVAPIRASHQISFFDGSMLTVSASKAQNDKPGLQPYLHLGSDVFYRRHKSDRVPPSHSTEVNVAGE
jgi:hypothetical protein